MEHMEMVEKLRTKANVTYEEAKAALESCNWDMLDAMILLEKQGKVRDASAAYDTASHSAGQDYEPVKATASAREKNKGWKNFCDWCKTLFRKSWVNTFRVVREGETIMNMPILLMLLLVFFCFWVVLPVMIVGLFFGCRYGFAGEDIKSDDVNAAMGKATDAAEGIKQSIINSVDENKK